MNFDIHGLVRVRANTRSPLLLTWLSRQLAEFGCGDIKDPDAIVGDFEDAPDLEGASVMGDYYFFSGGFLKIPSERVCYRLEERPLEIYCDRPPFPASLFVHLALLRKRHSLVHAAAFEFKGRRYLFPAFGGIGKTTLAAAIVFAGGKLYGDDMTIVGNKKIFGYPQDFSVYPYHVKMLGLRDPAIDKAFRKTAMLTKMTDMLERHDSRPARFLKRALESRKIPSVGVPPRKIFGGGCFAEPGAVDRAFNLVRVSSGSGDLFVKEIGAAALAKTCSEVLLHELSESVRHLHAYAALSSFSFERIGAETRAILEEFFAGVPCATIEIPSAMSNGDYQDKMLELLSERAAKE